MWIAALLAIAAPDGFAPARAAIVDFCRSEPVCVQEQTSEMGYFVTMMAGFRLTQSDLEACMGAGKKGRHVEWTIASSCLRERVKGRRLGR